MKRSGNVGPTFPRGDSLPQWNNSCPLQMGHRPQFISLCCVAAACCAHCSDPVSTSAWALWVLTFAIRSIAGSSGAESF